MASGPRPQIDDWVTVQPQVDDWVDVSSPGRGGSSQKAKPSQEYGPNGDGFTASFGKGMKTLFISPLAQPPGDVVADEQRAIDQIRKDPASFFIDQIPGVAKYKQVRDDLRRGRPLGDILGEGIGELIGGSVNTPIPLRKHPPVRPGPVRAAAANARNLMADSAPTQTAASLPLPGIKEPIRTPQRMRGGNPELPSGRQPGGIHNQYEDSPVQRRPSPVEPGEMRKLNAEIRELMGASIEQEPPPSVIGVPSELPSGRKPGGEHNFRPDPRPRQRPNPAWLGMEDVPAEPPISFTPIESGLPSGRSVGGPQNVPPPRDGRVPPPWKLFEEQTPVDAMPIDIPIQTKTASGRSVPSIDDRIRMANEPVAPKPPAPNPAPPPAPDPTHPILKTTESMAAAEQLRDMLAEWERPTGRQIKHQNPSVRNHDVTAENRVANIARHLKEKGITQADLETLDWDAEGATALANGPPELTINPATGKRVIKYNPIDRNGASVWKIKSRLFPEIYDPEGMGQYVPEPNPKGAKK